MTGAGFPHSDTLGSQLGCQLPEAYRSLLRPSSAPDAKASTVCPYLLDHKDARIHCVVLKEQPDTTTTTPPTHNPTTTQRPGVSGIAQQQPWKENTHQRVFPQDPRVCHH